MSALAGCSLIYNPSNLPEKSAPDIDAAIADANPALLRIDEVKSPPLLEGAGQDGSAPQVLVVFGGHITKSATVTLAPKEPNPDLVVELANVSIADDGNSIAGTVKVSYLDNLDETGANAVDKIDLVLTVTQEGAPAPVVFENEDLYVKPLDELTTVGAQAAPGPGKLYSRVTVNGGMDFAAGGQRVVIRAVGLIDIKGAVRANAAGIMGGAGGCNGGGLSTRGECFGGGGAGAGATAGGGGGGFAERGAGATGGMMSGDPLLATYGGGGPEMNRGGGGGGGQPTLVGALGGGPGGGGGGAIDIAGGGNVLVGSIEAKGDDGGVGGVGGGGGGGAGGAVVVRSGAMLTLSAVSVAPGAGGGGLGTGGAGSPGRWRFDANVLEGTVMGPTPGRGPMFNIPANPIFEIPNPALTVVGEAGSVVKIVVKDDSGQSDSRSVTLTQVTSVVEPPRLAIGYNSVCLVVAGGDVASDDGKNCIDVAFVP